MDLQALFDVSGKVVLVTGGGGGIGRMITEGFVSGGARVYIASRSDLTETAKTLADTGPGECIALRADLTKETEISTLGTELSDREGKLDVLVNNAGRNYLRRLERFDAELWDDINALNVRAPFLLARECIPLLTKAGESGAHATVINIASIDGIRIPSDNGWAYQVSKAGLMHLTRQLAGRMGNNFGAEGGRNITFNAVAPGPFPGMLDDALETEEGRTRISSATVVGRPGEAGDIAGACIYLASQAGAFVTGAVIPVDGGMLLGQAANG